MMAPAPPPSRPSLHERGRWDDLVAALDHETRLLDELRRALLQQRAGVASNDTGQIESSIQAMGRTLLTLNEARERRETLVRAAVGAPSSSLGDLENALSGTLPEAVHRARTSARRSGAAVAREVAINHHIVRRALDAGETFIQLLFSSVADPNPSYVPSSKDSGDVSHAGGILLNKRI